jgi:MFS family permease
MFQKCPMPTSQNSTDENVIPNCQPVFYDKSSMQPGQKSFITEYGYVCQKLKIAASLVSLMFTGVMSAAPFNYFTDIIGRKRMMLIACFMQTTALIFIWFSNNVWLYGTGMFFQGFFGGLKYKAADVLIIESVTQEYRSLAGTLLLIGFSLGYAFCPVLAYIFPDWRDMIKCMILIGFGACFVIQFLVLESTSWLFQIGTPEKLDEGVSNLKKLIPDERTRRLVETGLRNKNKARQTDNTDKSSFLDNMKYFATNKILIPRLCVNAVYWFCTSILFRSFAIGTSLLPGSPYTNAAISAGFDILACFLSYFVLKLVGRRSSLAASYCKV